MEEELLNDLKSFRDYCKNTENCGRCKRKHYALWNFCCEYLTNTNCNINPEDWKFDDDEDDDYEDVQPVVHAKWLYSPINFWKCSNCEFVIFKSETELKEYNKFCSRCGAKMDEEPEEWQHGSKD